MEKRRRERVLCLPAPTGSKKQAPPANCWPLRREIAAALWRVKRVNNCGFPRRVDFKRVFEARSQARRQIPAAFGLTGIATMLIKRRLGHKGEIACGIS
jgi:hypothetical protein